MPGLPCKAERSSSDLSRNSSLSLGADIAIAISGFIFLLGIILFITPVYAADIVSGLVGHWKLNGSAGDYSGNGNSGTIVGATATTDRFGRANSAMSFDGSSYIRCPTSSSLNFGTGDFTVSFWTYRTVYGFQGGAYVGKTLSATTMPGFDIYDGQWRGLDVRTSTGRLAFVYIHAAYNVWQFHAFVVTQVSSPYIKHYVNGVMDQTGYTEVGNKGSVNNSGDFLIGYSTAGGANRYFNGSMDEVKIYNRALTAADVLALYSGGGSTKLRNCVIRGAVIR